MVTFRHQYFRNIKDRYITLPFFHISHEDIAKYDIFTMQNMNFFLSFTQRTTTVSPHNTYIFSRPIPINTIYVYILYMPMQELLHTIWQQVHGHHELLKIILPVLVDTMFYIFFVSRATASLFLANGSKVQLSSSLWNERKMRWRMWMWERKTEDERDE